MSFLKRKSACNAGPAYVQHLHLVITVPADVPDCNSGTIADKNNLDMSLLVALVVKKGLRNHAFDIQPSPSLYVNHWQAQLAHYSEVDKVSSMFHRYKWFWLNFPWWNGIVQNDLGDRKVPEE